MVLAGGLSKRLGRDKAALRLSGYGAADASANKAPCATCKAADAAPNACSEAVHSRSGEDANAAITETVGPDLLNRTALLLQGLVPRVLIAGRAQAGFEHIDDERPGIGPAGAIATALRHTGQPCLVLSCDLPFMDAPTLTRLLEARAARPPRALLTAWRCAQTGNVEHLAAIYEPAALPLLDASLERGLPKISLILPRERQHCLDYAPEEALPFFNINYPADLLLARKYLELLKER